MSLTWITGQREVTLMRQGREIGHVEYVESKGWVWILLDRSPIDFKIYSKSSYSYFPTQERAQEALLTQVEKGVSPLNYFDSTPGWTDAHVREVRARRYELAAVLIRRGEDELPIVEMNTPWRGIVWRTRLEALDRMVNLKNEVDFRRSVAMAGFNPDEEVGLVVARAEGKQA
jgi:hypothetical protein